MTIFAITAVGPHIPLVTEAEYLLSDLRIATLYKKVPPHRDIVIVEITEETVAETGRRSPIDRAFLAELLRDLEDAGARAIGLDVLFDQKTERDKALQTTLKGLSLPTVLAWADAMPDRGGLQPWQHEFLVEFFESIQNPQVKFGRSELLVDPDGTIRRHRAIDKSSAVPLSLAAALSEAVGVAPPDEATFTLAYYGRPNAESRPFNTLRAEQIDPAPGPLWEAQKRVLGDRIVLIGGEMPGIDRHRTPFITVGERSTSGVLIHAHALAQILDGRRQQPAPATIIIVVALLVCTAGFALGLASVGATTRGIAGAAVIVTIWVAAFVIYAGAWPGSRPGEHGPLFPLASPTLGFCAALAFGIGTARKRFRTERDFTRNVLMRYVAPSIVKRLLEDPSRLRLGGEIREMSFVFTDIAGFTTLSEKLHPTVLVDTLNAYLDGMSRIIHAANGTLDKIVGDGMDAFWGAPLDDPEHARHAIECAKAMSHFAGEFAKRQNAEGIPFGGTRIGVHSGRVTVGNFGGKVRMEYGAHGDVVNTASRLEGASKYLGTQVLVSESTANQCDPAQFRPVGKLVLKGKAQAIMVFELIVTKSPLREKYREAYDLLDDNVQAAIAALRALLAQRPDDRLAAFHLQRLLRGEKGTIIKLEGK